MKEIVKPQSEVRGSGNRIVVLAGGVAGREAEFWDKIDCRISFKHIWAIMTIVGVLALLTEYLNQFGLNIHIDWGEKAHWQRS